MFIIPRILANSLHLFVGFSVLGIPIIHLTSIITLANFMLVLYVNKGSEKIELLALLYISIVVIFSSFLNPIRDVYMEAQGVVLFLIEFSLFWTILKQNISLRKFAMRALLLIPSSFLIFFIVSVLTSRIIIPGDILLQSGGRMEGIITSSIIIGLIVLTLTERNFIATFVGALAVFLLLVVTVTRSTILASLIVMLIHVVNTIRTKRLVNILLYVIAVLLFSVGIYSMFLYYLPDYFEILIYRINNKSGGSLSYRWLEMFKELSLFFKSPLTGSGLGIRYDSSLILSGNKSFFGHNILTSQLARYGILGLLVFFIYTISMFNRYLRADKELRSYFVLSIVGVTLISVPANFIYFPITGFYGALFACLLASNQVRNQNISKHYLI